MLFFFNDENIYIEGTLCSLNIEYSVENILLEENSFSNIISMIFKKISEFFKMLYETFKKFIYDVSKKYKQIIEKYHIKNNIKELKKKNPRDMILYSDLWSYQKHMDQYIIQLKRLKQEVIACTIYDYASPKVVDNVISDFKKAREMYTKLLADDLNRKVNIRVYKIIAFLENMLINNQGLDTVSNELSDLYSYFDDLSERFNDYLSNTDTFRTVKNIDPDAVNRKTQALKNEIFNNITWVKNNKLIATEYVLQSIITLSQIYTTAKPLVNGLKSDISIGQKMAEEYLSNPDMSIDAVSKAMNDNLTKSITDADTALGSNEVLRMGKDYIGENIAKRKSTTDYVMNNMMRVK